MEDIHLHLKNLGFTDLEAKCLHVLAECGTQTGYEIAKQLGVSRSNVYSALQKLAEKGAVLTSHGEPTHYQSVPIEEIGERVEAELLASIRYVKEHMPKQGAHRSEYFSLEGDAKVLDRIRAELRKAKEEVLCDLWTHEAQLLKEELLQVPAQGVRLLVSTIGDAVPLSGVHQFLHKRDAGRSERKGRKFTLLIDRKLAIIGTRGGDEPTLAMLTEHPAMVDVLLNSFWREVVIHELQQDMGGKLEDKYGKNFKKIIQKYTEGKEKDSQPGIVGTSPEGKSTESKALEGRTQESKSSESKFPEDKSSEGKTHEGLADEGESAESKSNESKSNESKIDGSKSNEGKSDGSKSNASKSDESKSNEEKPKEGKVGEGKRKKKK
ncbi:TrmB family transcriptional regulator [Paenibacillus alba]|uniref:Helix-turn-helix domain-containing protein n=1 Tax=Paenibacillus alba TaxID=1197127 RepID=A0ABU6G1P5_9BACL|nr:helix-turn-helix domain-containing protein [Paenibacillus alba]MEC0227500.1 helix-turn-helix domain-containing protein [Paenibacillus alba]